VEQEAWEGEGVLGFCVEKEGINHSVSFSNWKVEEYDDCSAAAEDEESGTTSSK
jgi:hypothetical protein